MNMSAKSSNYVKIELNISDQVTSISCGNIVVEFIKFLTYQRLQIPYTYQWLKQLMNKMKTLEGKDINQSYASERHFHLVFSSLGNLDYILKSLLQEINESSIPEEICIAFGPTSISYKEVYRILMPSVCHKPQCHSTNIATDQKIQRNIFRTLVTSEALNEVYFHPMLPTNMHVMIKKKISNQNFVINDSFAPFSGCLISKSSKVVVLDFRTKNKENLSCCNDFKIYGDTLSDGIINLHIKEGLDSEHKADNYHEIESTEDSKWYKSVYVMKGFQDYFINGSSVMNNWLNL